MLRQSIQIGVLCKYTESCQSSVMQHTTQESMSSASVPLNTSVKKEILFGR